MSFTAKSIIDRARAKWKESAEGDMLTDVQCLPALTDALMAVRSARPEAYMDYYTGVMYDLVDVTSVNQVILVQDRFREALAAHLTMTGYSGNADQQKNEERANAWSAKFKALVMSA